MHSFICFDSRVGDAIVFHNMARQRRWRVIRFASYRFPFLRSASSRLVLRFIVVEHIVVSSEAPWSVQSLESVGVWYQRFLLDLEAVIRLAHTHFEHRFAL